MMMRRRNHVGKAKHCTTLQSIKYKVKYKAKQSTTQTTGIKSKRTKILADQIGEEQLYEDLGITKYK